MSGLSQRNKNRIFHIFYSYCLNKYSRENKKYLKSVQQFTYKKKSTAPANVAY